jgi:hypothetical protein
MEKSKSLLTLILTEQASRENQMSSMGISSEFSRLLQIRESMVHQLAGDFTKEDLDETVEYFVKDSVRLHYPETTEYLMYIYVNVLHDRTSSLTKTIQKTINDNFLTSRRITLVIFTENLEVYKYLDTQLKNEKVTFNWVIFNLDNLGNVLITVLNRYTHMLDDIYLDELFQLFITELYNSWEFNTNPIVSVSCIDLFTSYIL